MKLRSLSPSKKLHGVPVLVRVDWNVPTEGAFAAEDSLKLTRSIPFIQSLSARGAVVIILTHLGRPKKRERTLSTRQLVPRLKKLGLDLIFHPEPPVSVTLETAKPGSVHLLENVRFEAGEEKNSPVLVQAYARLGRLFMNDAFATCHRKHASVLGLAKAFGSNAYASPGLIEEVTQLSKLLETPKRPFVAVVGGKKLTTKMPIIKTLLQECDAVLVGGAMATPFFRAQKLEIGKSFCEDQAIPAARAVAKHRNLFLPADVMVAPRIDANMKPKPKLIAHLGKKDVIVDVGPATLVAWGSLLRQAKTILWNGPVGVTEVRAGGFGTRFLARHIGVHARGPAFAIAGGGDTIPVIYQTKTESGFDFISTGGGAMLEFIANKGDLPGLEPLRRNL